MKLVIKGRPITKKNSQRYVGRGRLLQSKAYVEYEQAALWQLKAQRRGQGLGTANIHLKVSYFMPNRRGWPDLVGLMQATADILEKAGIYENDRQVTCWDGTKIAGIDKDNPRAVIEVVALDE